LITA